MNSSYNKILKHIKGKRTFEDLVAITEMADSLDDKAMECITDFANQEDLDLDDFYYSENTAKPYVYYNPPYYYAFMGLGGDMEDMLDFERKGFQLIMNKIDETLNNKDYSMYFYHVEGPYDLLLFNKLFNSLEGQDKYDVLTDLYVSSEYGHSQITREMWAEAIEERASDYDVALPVEDEVLTIYRGESSESTNITEAMSWTLKASVASRFLGYSIGVDSNLYKAKIKRADVIDYIDSRNEAEVICFPEDIYHVDQIEQRNPVELYQELEDSRIVDEFVYYRSSVLSKITGFNEGAHSRLHSVRVMLLALTLGELSGVSDRDRAILANVAMYHDSARDHDGVDSTHGKKAVKQIEEEGDKLLSITCKGIDSEYDLGFLTEEEEDIAKFIIKWHCVDDAEVAEQLSKIHDNERTETLFKLFKDADALDRVRLRDLDINYLRHELSTRLVGFAHFVYSAIK